MRNQGIGLCAIAVLVASCSTAQPLPGSGEGQAHQLRREAASSPVQGLRLMAEQGNAEAQFNLGLMYDRGRGVLKDKREAIRWYRAAAGQGDTFAQNALGDNYWEGTGVPKDDTEAVRWWRFAAGKGFVPAQHSLGKILSGGGQGVRPAKVQAYMWLALSAAQGDQEAGRQRDILSKQLMPAEIMHAKQLVDQWKPDRGNGAANGIMQ